MQLTEIEAVIESLLFVAGETVPLEKIAQVIKQDKNTTNKIIRSMMDSYNKEGRGIQIIELDGAYQMCTKPQYFEYIKLLYKTPQKHVLTQPLLETLSIIAYKQPITKAQVEDIRGVRCDHVVNKLIEYNLVCEIGRLDAPGRPILFGTTEEFLRYFGFSSLNELPGIENEVVEEIYKEVQSEVDKKYPRDNQKDQEGENL